MCEFCRESSGGQAQCAFCSASVCFDLWDNDIVHPAVEVDGDIYCAYCAEKQRRADTDLDFGQLDPFEDSLREEYVGRRIREHEERGDTSYNVGDFYEEWATRDRYTGGPLEWPGAADCHRGFFLRTDVGRVAHILGDPEMDEKTRAALKELVDAAYDAITSGTLELNSDEEA